MQDTQVKITIPTSWNDVTVGQFQEYIEISNDKETKGYKKIIQQISVLTDMDEKVFYELPYTYLYEIQKEISYLSNEPTFEFKNIILIDDIEYGFQKDFHKLTLGEWIDLEAYVSGGVVKNLHYIAAILYRPITKKGTEYFDYEIASYSDIQLENAAKYLKNKISINDIYGISVFFYHIVKELIQPMLFSFKKLTKKQKVEKKKMMLKMLQKLEEPEVEKKLKQLQESYLSKNGTGSFSSILSQMVI